MAHFYGGVQGGRTQATRLGTKGSGLDVFAASWEGAVSVRLYEQDGKDFAHVQLKPWHGHGITRTLYDGPVGGSNEDRSNK